MIEHYPDWIPDCVFAQLGTPQAPPGAGTQPIENPGTLIGHIRTTRAQLWLLQCLEPTIGEGNCIFRIFDRHFFG